MGKRGAGRRLNDQERMEILDLLAKEAKVKNVDLAKRYGVSEGAIRKLKQIKDTIRDRYVLGNEHNRDKRKRGGFRRNAQFEQELYAWICRMRETQAYQLIPLTQTAVRQQAIMLAKNYETMSTFKASPGWFARFCSRHRLDPPMNPGTSDGVTSMGAIAHSTTAVPESLLPVSAGLVGDVVRMPEESEAALAMGFQSVDTIQTLVGGPAVDIGVVAAPVELEQPAVEKKDENPRAVDLNCPEAIDEQAQTQAQLAAAEQAQAQAQAQLAAAEAQLAAAAAAVHEENAALSASLKAGEQVKSDPAASQPENPQSPEPKREAEAL
uniref:HTH CENPB-type domain-containing protein n=1 Tax=Globisporangium ultimum (strain ATCC 200006 / CBS 805.95 / DAOM BR144) TaxID=431595 RepID=K3WEA0_GLOUD